ncbi:MAG: hypothetical protein ABIK62_05465 [candidate division WOR-3 bacterium]
MIFRSMWAGQERPGPRLLLAVSVLALLFVFGCHDTTPPPWPWWTKADSTAVLSELAAGRDSTETRLFIEGRVQPLIDSSAITARDSTSPTGDSLIKITRLAGFGIHTGSLVHSDSLLFGVTVDSLSPEVTGDTFCQVIVRDSSANDFCVLSYDEYWVIKYRQVITIDTTVTPPETTVTYRLDSLAPPPYAVRGAAQSQKEVSSMAKRYVYLRKSGSSYALRRMSGYGLYLPTSTSAPVVRYMVLSRLGILDTFKLSAQADHRHGIYNLRDRDSLYTVKAGESLGVFIRTDAPKSGDKFYYLARIDTTRVLFNRGDSMLGMRRVVFREPGIKHLVVEVVPQSNLLYPNSEFSAAIWSLPIRVEP